MGLNAAAKGGKDSRTPPAWLSGSRCLYIHRHTQFLKFKEPATEQLEQGYDTVWRGLLLSHLAEFSQSIDAYQQDLGRQIQTAEIHLGLRAGFMPPKVPYRPLHWPFIESIFSRGLG